MPLLRSQRLPMALTAYTKLGLYEIVAPLGAGDMGEAYKARRARLSRNVTVKMLPTSFSTDADRLQRVEHEACATGLLNHPPQRDCPCVKTSRRRLAS
jgi:eukaryotic-like serine/threonine-protein kinase